jgi:crotonobetainyl-CoA:carnitine CoA-transferase CaiB-like acyl-CoA transferase
MTGQADQAAPQAPALPLTGITVVALEQAVAAPFATRLAALLAGADVFVQNLAPGAAGRLGLGAASTGDPAARPPDHPPPAAR